MKCKRSNQNNISSTEARRNEISRLQDLYKQLHSAELPQYERFDSMPLSAATTRGLKAAGYQHVSDIQKRAIPPALIGRDVMGAARTGSGKTLAFVVPILESLFVSEWSRDDGLAALVITPTRELAYQIYSVLTSVGAHHDFSVALIIGGKDLKFERKRMDCINIIICTPGRILQHMDENPLFNCDTLKLLVLDEADKCLEMGFAPTMNAIIENLPADRQTLLFSATQTRSVDDLTRLSLSQPLYVSTHEITQSTTGSEVTSAEVTTTMPSTLAHSYVVCEQHDKLDLLWSFLRYHKHRKCLVFVHTCKQAKYIHEVLTRLRPGVCVLALYGDMHQLRRMAVYDQFCRKQNALLLATDVASRGLDFPSVNWVVQLDCPLDVRVYVHRAGRTARFDKEGESLLVLTRSQSAAMIEQLTELNISLERIEVNSLKMTSIQRKLDAMLAHDVELKESAKRALQAYCKSIHLMKDKRVFNVRSIDIEAFARSLGLSAPPRIRFLNKYLKSRQSNEGATTVAADTGTSTLQTAQSVKSQPLTQYNFHDGFVQDQMDGDFLTLKRTLNGVSDAGSERISGTEGDEDIEAELANIRQLRTAKKSGKIRAAKKMLKKTNVQLNTHIVFDSETQPILDKFRHQTTAVSLDYQNSRVEQSQQQQQQGANNAQSLCEQSAPILPGRDNERARRVMEAEDVTDRRIYSEKIKAMHRERRLKTKEQNLSRQYDHLFQSSDEDSGENQPDSDDNQPQKSRKSKKRKKTPLLHAYHVRNRLEDECQTGSSLQDCSVDDIEREEELALKLLKNT